MTDWIEKARRRLGLEAVGLDPDYLPAFGEDEAKSLVEKISALGRETGKTTKTPLSCAIDHSGDGEPFRAPEKIAYSENLTDKTDKTIEPIELPSRGELTKPTKLLGEDHRAILEAAARARPPDVKDAQWGGALKGLRAFLEDGHAASAEGAGWPRDELYRVPPLWARVDLCGPALLIGDCEVISITPGAIQIKTASGATQSFYRKPEVDYRLVYETRRMLLRRDVNDDEAHCRAYEYAVSVFRDNHRNTSLEDAKAAVLAAIERSSMTETTTP